MMVLAVNVCIELILTHRSDFFLILNKMIINGISLYILITDISTSYHKIKVLHVLLLNGKCLSIQKGVVCNSTTLHVAHSQPFNRRIMYSVMHICSCVCF